MEEFDFAALQALFADNQDTSGAVTAAYELLLGGVPNQEGFFFLINNAVDTNYGSGPGVTFNQENIFINIVNSLIQGNNQAATAFTQLLGGATTLTEQVAALYAAIVPADNQSAEGLAFLIRPDALAFYQAAANERGVEGDLGPAIVALASLLDIAVDANFGIGAQVNSLAEAIANGNSGLPIEGDSVIPLADVLPADSGGGGGGGGGGAPGDTTGPAFTSGDFTIDENLTSVGTVNATDPSDPVTYAITGGPDAAALSIDANTGALSFNTAPDADTAGDDDGDNVYEITVTATDTVGNTTTQDISVTVNDIANELIVDGVGGTPGRYATVQDAVTAAVDGDQILVENGTFSIGSQVVIDKDITLIGAGKTDTVLQAGFNTGASGDSRGLFLVDDGVEFNVHDLTIDGNGNDVHQAVRHKGSGTFDNVAFNDIQFNPSGPTYAGTAIAVFGASSAVDVTNSMFSDIGRVGVLYFGSGTTGTFAGNVFVGKGAGNHLDYALDIGNGAVIDVTGNTISNMKGVASSDGSVSAGILVSTFFGPGTQATLAGNTISDSSNAVFIGFNDTDTSSVTFGEGNDFSSGNGTGVRGVGNIDVTGAPNVNGTFDYDGGDAANPFQGSGLNDTLDGGRGADILTGGGGEDTINGDRGADEIFGGDDNDMISGGRGGDTIAGEAGDDNLSGNQGSDVFVFAANGGMDTITDFNSGSDVLDVGALGISFAQLDSVSDGVIDDNDASASLAGGDLTVDLGGGTSVVLQGVSSLQGSDFIF